MPANPTESQDPLPQIDAVIAEYYLAQENGAPLQPAELLAKYPAIAEELEEFFSGLEDLEAISRGPAPENDRPQSTWQAPESTPDSPAPDREQQWPRGQLQARRARGGAQSFGVSARRRHGRGVRGGTATLRAVRAAVRDGVQAHPRLFRVGDGAARRAASPAAEKQRRVSGRRRNHRALAPTVCAWNTHGA